MTVKVILCENVAHLGRMGATVKVADGYARNFLIPRKLAVAANSGSGREIEHHMRIIKRREEKRRTEYTALAKKMEGTTLEFKMLAGEEDKLFGSVTTANIAEKLVELGYAVDKKSIKLEDPIKSLGIFTVPVNIGMGVIAQIKVWVSKEEREEEAKEAAE